MKARLFLTVLLPVLLFAVLATGCGGGSKESTEELSPEDIAVVGKTHILKARFDSLMKQAALNLKAQGQPFPKAGTTQYAGFKSQAVTLLVQQAQREAAAEALGLTVTPKEVEKKLAEIKKQYFGGKEKAYLAALKKQGVTDADVRDNLESQLISTKLYDSLTGEVTVPNSAIVQYYAQHVSEFQTTASRNIRYILVGKNKAALAENLFKQLQAAPQDATWYPLVKKYSQDPSATGGCSSADVKVKDSSCGRIAATKGQTVPEFDKLAFSLPTGKVALVNTKQYGWFVLQGIDDIVPAKKTPVEEASKTISDQLLKEKKDEFMTKWVDNTQKDYCDGRIEYQAGYAPSPDPCDATSTTTTTTTTTTTPATP